MTKLQCKTESGIRAREARGQESPDQGPGGRGAGKDSPGQSLPAAQPQRTACTQGHRAKWTLGEEGRGSRVLCD